MKFRIEFNCDNDAFWVAGKWFNYKEIERILESEAHRMQMENSIGGYWSIRDSNGNIIGYAELMED